MGQYYADPDLIALIRQMQRELQEAQANGQVIATGSGAPTTAPEDGALYLDTTGNNLYGRTKGTWKKVTLA